MTEAKSEKGTKDNPLTREDVLEAIGNNGEKAEGLDFSGKWFKDQVNLSGLDLSGIRLNNSYLFLANFNGSTLDKAEFQGAALGYATFNPLSDKRASLVYAQFGQANLRYAEFQQANLTGARFEKTERLLPASLDQTDLRGAELRLAEFKGCWFYGTKLEGAFIRGAAIFEAHLEETDWGSYQMGEESRKHELYFAESYYRRLKVWFANAGYPTIAAEFYYREKEAGRKSLRLLSSSWRNRLAAEIMYAFFGYGERWRRILWWILGVTVGSALLFFILGGVFPNASTSERFLGSLYYSVVSFTALGYGPWFDFSSVQGWAQGVGAAESFLGVFMMAALLVTFVRKWTR